jgi:hypothetical protein
MKCKHWKNIGKNWGGECLNPLALFPSGRKVGQYPTQHACSQCTAYDGPARGIGDVIAKVAKAVGIKPCEGCEKRRAKLNAKLPLTE